MIYAIIALAVTNIVTLLLFIRSRHLNAQISDNPRQLKEWLQVHDRLQKSARCMLMISQVDESSVFYREPPR